MTRILVVWEDRYHDTLGPFVKKRLAARAPAGHTGFPQVLFHTSYGNGGFNRYASSTWDNVRARGLPTSAGAIDHLVCIADADKLHDQLDAIARPPSETADVGAWLAAAERAWEEHLRGLCEKAPPTSLHGRLLRWSKESLVLAGFDRQAARQRLGIDIESTAVKDHLSRCAPVPISVNGAAFSDTFRRPLRCLGELDRAQRGAQGSSLTKASPEIDDALRDLARDDCAIIAERVPDIDRLTDAIWNLAAPARASRQ